jgi:hypothetical protein
MYDAPNKKRVPGYQMHPGTYLMNQLEMEYNK